MPYRYEYFVTIATTVSTILCFSIALLPSYSEFEAFISVSDE